MYAGSFICLNMSCTLYLKTSQQAMQHKYLMQKHCGLRITIFCSSFNFSLDTFRSVSGEIKKNF